MVDTDRKIMEVFWRALPNLSEADKEKLLAFGEGVALIAERQRAAQNSA